MAPTAPVREPEMQDTPPCRPIDTRIPEALKIKTSGIGAGNRTRTCTAFATGT